MWSKATKKELKDFVTSEVMKMHEGGYRVRAVSQNQKGQWAQMWKMPLAKLRFLIRATYTSPPSLQILHFWYGSEDGC